jgi:hypothetical protein
VNEFRHPLRTVELAAFTEIYDADGRLVATVPKDENRLDFQKLRERAKEYYSRTFAAFDKSEVPL